MGEGITGKAISWQFYDRFKPIGDRMAEMKANGEDPGKIDLDSVKGAPGKGRKKGQAVLQHLFSTAQHISFALKFCVLTPGQRLRESWAVTPLQEEFTSNSWSVTSPLANGS